jgi:hypothetical protein
MLRSTSELGRSGTVSLDNRTRRQLAPVLFIFVIHAVSNSRQKWDSQLLTLVLSGYKLEASREDNYAEPIPSTRAKCSFFKSYYVDDTAFIAAEK